MKIIIQSNYDPYGLSRSDLEAVCGVLAVPLVQRVRQVVLVANSWGAEHFEYDPTTETANFAYRGDASDQQIRDGALRALLLGFARLESGGEFRIPLSDRQRDSFRSFIDQWYPRCASAIAAAHLTGHSSRTAAPAAKRPRR